MELLKRNISNKSTYMKVNSSVILYSLASKGFKLAVDSLRINIIALNGLYKIFTSIFRAMVLSIDYSRLYTRTKSKLCNLKGYAHSILDNVWLMLKSSLTRYQ